MELTPPEPKYYQYMFDNNTDSVVVKVESDDRLCLLFSIQDTHCPVFDLVRNVEFTGEYQSVTKKGAITVTVSLKIYKPGVTVRQPPRGILEEQAKHIYIL